MPLIEAGLVLGVHGGNHEYRVKKDTNYDMLQEFCISCGIKYLLPVQRHEITAGKQKYYIQTQHGKGSAKTLAGKMRKINNLININPFMDIVAYAHTHTLHVEYYVFSDKHGRQYERDALLTGGYLHYTGQYSEHCEYAPVSRGCVVVELWASEKHREYAFLKTETFLK